MATFNRMVRSSVVEIVGTPSPNRSAFTTLPSSMERPASSSRSKEIRPLWSPQWPRSPPPSQRYLTLGVPPLHQEESAGPEDVRQNTPEADSTEAAVVVDLTETAEPEEQEAEPEPRRATGVLAEEGPWRSGRVSHPPNRYSPNR